MSPLRKRRYGQMKIRTFFMALVTAYCFLALLSCKTTPPEPQPEETTQEIAPTEPQPEPSSPAVAETPPSQPQETPEPPELKEEHVRVTVGAANVRSKPSMEGKIIAVVKKDALYVSTGEEGDWLRIRLRDDREGWIYHQLVEEVQEQ